MSLKLLFLFCLLRLGLGASSSTSPSPTTVPSPTKTSCPLYHVTELSPKPSNYTCGGQGALSKPNLLGTYCDFEFFGTDLDDYDCYRVCARDSRCISFSFDPKNQACYTYGKTLIDMGYKPANKYQFFYNLKGCFSCQEAPPPAKSSCPEQHIAKKPAPKNYTCGAPGYLQNQTYLGYYSPYDSDDLENACYRYCLDHFDPINKCVSFALEAQGPFGNCYAYGETLLEKGFRYNTSSDLYAWNTRGCFECNDPPYVDPVCSKSPPTTPLDTGVRNGNFSNTVPGQRPGWLLPAEWDILPVSLAPLNVTKVAGGNMVAALNCSTEGDHYYQPTSFMSQVLYPNIALANKTDYFNLTFDLAIPLRSPSAVSTRAYCALTFGPREIYSILGSDSRYAGSTLKPAGPFPVDYPFDWQENGISIGFKADCNYDDANSTTTFLIDNVRAVANGRDWSKV